MIPATKGEGTDTMSDLEMTRLAAEAMGLKPSRSEITEGHWLDGNEWIVYDPLHDDAQAMALVKRFDLDIFTRDDFRRPGKWDVSTDDDKCCGVSDDLNRAIVECVAKMQRSVQSQDKATGQMIREVS